MQNPYTWASACVTGASHHACGAPCEDAVASRLVTIDGTRYFIVAVSDGMGSARHGGRGAKVAANAFVDLAAKRLATRRSWSGPGFLGVAKAAAADVHHVLLRFASRIEAHPMDYAATLLACITDGKRSAFVQIGDGVIITGPVRTSWRPVFAPQRGEYANISKFITEANALEKLQARLHVGLLRNIALMTDGVEPLVLARGVVNPTLFDHLASVMGGLTRPGPVAALSTQLATLLSGPLVQDRIGDDASLFTLHIGDAP